MTGPRPPSDRTPAALPSEDETEQLFRSVPVARSSRAPAPAWGARLAALPRPRPRVFVAIVLAGLASVTAITTGDINGTLHSTTPPVVRTGLLDAPTGPPSAGTRLVDFPAMTCAAGLPTTTDERVTSVDCDVTDAPRIRVLGLVLLPVGRFTGIENERATAAERCRSRFPALVYNGSGEESGEFRAVVPSGRAWADGARLAVCAEVLA
ncbi:hypothetical protein [Kineosporia sp. R_H_3]|uniref:hypothetical protein n=1 Tax=Kineosporia sp. R_H_3 TaxID=1961848 RepID=UPI000B4BB13C|nr:hypothetical protein [Kineosporia sp. R_H_3]